MVMIKKYILHFCAKYFKMGVERMFSDKAEFNDLFDASGGVTVNKAVQKSFIEVDEYGAVAAAVTGKFLNDFMESLFYFYWFN